MNNAKNLQSFSLLVLRYVFKNAWIDGAGMLFLKHYECTIRCQRPVFTGSSSNWKGSSVCSFERAKEREREREREKEKKICGKMESSFFLSNSPSPSSHPLPFVLLYNWASFR